MKKIIIFSYSEYAAQFHKQTLERIFGDQLEVDYWLVSDHTKEKVHADLAVLVSGSILDYAKLYLEPDTPMTTVTYTLERETVQRIKEIAGTESLSLVSYTRYQILESRKALLADMGIEKSRLEIYDETDADKHLENHVIFFGRSIPETLKHHEVIQICSRSIGIGTILEIMLALGLDGSRCQQTILDYYRRVNPFHCTNDYETIVKDAGVGVFSGRADAVVMFNNLCNIHYCNEAAERLLKLPMEEYMDKSLYRIFPFLKKGSVSELENFGEQVVDFKGRLHIVRIEMSYLHNAVIGTMYLSNYWDLQKRHDNLERQMHRKHHEAKYNFFQLIGNSEKMVKCKAIAKRMADSDENILIRGQSGVGKELFAQAIHNTSSRKKYPFVAINCGAMVDTLMESELFGYEEGAFTGAKKGGRQGFFEAANHGTLFLDEIGEMPLHLQTRLLRVLQEHEIVRVGGSDVVPVDVRVIAATHQDLVQMIKNKTFRADLYYRICVLPLSIPALAERREDIPLLVEYFKQKKNYSFTISEAASRYMEHYDYEGNIRELENALSYLSNLKKEVIEVEDLPEYMQDMNLAIAVSDVGKSQSTAAGVTDRTDMKYQVLKAVKAINDTGIGAGRRSIRELLMQNNCALCESGVRRIMHELQAENLICVSPGRGGSRITAAGVEYIAR